MNLWLGKNNVMPNLSIGDTSKLDLSSDFDMSLEDGESWNKIEVFLGTNGIGKSFIGKVISYLAFLHANLYKPQNLNTSKIAKALYEMGFGTLKEDSPIIIIGHIDGSGSNTSNYWVNIGASAKSIFDNYSVIYYSNSQFPSNESFFSNESTSLNASNVDIVFWHIKKKIKTKNLQVCYGFDQNESVFNKENSFVENDEKRNIPDLQTFDSMYYGTNRQVFEDLPASLCYWENLKKSTIAQNLINKAKNKDYKKEWIDISTLEIEDYLAILFLKNLFSDIYFEIIYDSIPWKVLNSFSKYKLILFCLINMSSTRTLLIVDEPENSMHLSIQEMMVRKLSNDYKYIAMTNSPEFVNSLLNYKNKKTYSINHLLKDEHKKIKCEIVDSKSIQSSLDVIAAELFGVSPNYKKWSTLNPEPIDQSCLMNFESFYEEINDLSES